MLSEPGGKAWVAKVTVPPLSGFLPSTVAPFWKVTMPVGVPLPDCGVTVAVNVTDLPWIDGFTDELSVVLVPLGFPVNPKICNCWLLATKTRPLATTGTRFELPPVLGQLPAVDENKFVIVLLPESGLNA